jgi:hypothetical protein
MIMIKKKKQLTFWRPVNVKVKPNKINAYIKFGIKPSKVKVSHVNYLNPVPMFKPKIGIQKSKSKLNVKFMNTSIYHGNRTKKEWNLIGRDPFGDRDKDGVRNMFDCRPLNRKKKGMIGGVKGYGGNTSIRGVPMHQVPEDLRKTAIRTIEDIKKFNIDIDKITAQHFPGQISVKPFFIKPISELQKRGYVSTKSGSFYNEPTGEIGQRITIEGRLPQSLINEINKNTFVKAKVTPDASGTVLIFNQKDKTPEEVEKEMFALAESFPMKGVSPNLQVSKDLLLRVENYEKNAETDALDLKHPDLKSRIHPELKRDNIDENNNMIPDSYEDEPVSDIPNVQVRRRGRGRPSKVSLQQKEETREFVARLQEQYEKNKTEANDLNKLNGGE